MTGLASRGIRTVAPAETTFDTVAEAGGTEPAKAPYSYVTHL
jgi:hypothetical protein